MEFGRAGVLNEGTIASLNPAFCRRPLADLMDNQMAFMSIWIG